jgi:hypothetical protein
MVLLAACSETPRCVDRGTPERPRVVVECNAGKVAVCGNDPDLIYDTSGALLPVPPDSVTNGSCDGFTGPCRPRPVCGSAGAAPTCATGEGAVCTLGAVRTATPPRPDSGPPPPPPDSGPPPPEDAGPGDAGSDDGGN